MKIKNSKYPNLIFRKILMIKHVSKLSVLFSKNFLNVNIFIHFFYNIFLKIGFQVGYSEFIFNIKKFFLGNF